MISQAGAVAVSSIEELIDVAVSFHFLPPITGRRVGVAAGAGGATVLAADQCEEAGLDVIALPQKIRDDLKSQDIQIWDWIGNPADFSINMGDTGFAAPQLLKMMAMDPNFDLIIASIGAPGGGGPPNRGAPPVKGSPPPVVNQPMSVEAFLDQYIQINDYKPVLGLVQDRTPGTNGMDDERWKSVCEVTGKLIDLKIPYYPPISRAARAVNKVIAYYQSKER